MRKWMIGFTLTVFLTGFSMIAADGYHLFYRPLPRNASGTTPLLVTLDKKTTAFSFAHDLTSKYLIQSPRLFLWSIRIQGLSNRLKAGVYEIKPGETAQQFLMRVVSGDVLIIPFRITDGTTQRSVAAQLAQQPYLSQQPNDWMAIAKGHPSAEGLLMADTYYYDAGSQSTQLLMMAHNSLMRFLNESWEKRSPNLPYKTPYEMLIAASIIEREASMPDEKRLISGVIVNRLHKRMPLQMDPTVIYALGSQFQGRLTHQDLSVDSPFNTYIHYGLPPTPIAMVGRDAIDAAAHPTLTHYLYFVASGDGRHHFSETYEQQRKAISDLK